MDLEGDGSDGEDIPINNEQTEVEDEEPVQQMDEDNHDADVDDDEMLIWKSLMPHLWCSRLLEGRRASKSGNSLMMPF